MTMPFNKKTTLYTPFLSREFVKKSDHQKLDEKNIFLIKDIDLITHKFDQEIKILQADLQSFSKFHQSLVDFIDKQSTHPDHDPFNTEYNKELCFSACYNQTVSFDSAWFSKYDLLQPLQSFKNEISNYLEGTTDLSYKGSLKKNARHFFEKLDSVPEIINQKIEELSSHIKKLDEKKNEIISKNSLQKKSKCSDNPLSEYLKSI